MNFSDSSAVCRSPVISATGTRWCSATSALMPLSPTRTPFSSTWLTTDGLYECDRIALSPLIEPW